MKRYIRLILVLIVSCIMLCSCGQGKVEETPITYSPWLNGVWESVSVAGYCYYPLRQSEEVADVLVGKTYDFKVMNQGTVEGGVLPIRDAETQYFFWSEFPYCLSELGLEENYYAILHFESSDGMNHPCIFVKNRNEMLLTEAQTGVFNICRNEENIEQVIYTYDSTQSFEDNIRIRMRQQGITYESYYNGVWEGHWVIEEVIYGEDKEVAEGHIGEVVEYIEDIDSFDLQFIEGAEDRVFYGLPTVEELGLAGDYYVIIWDEDHEYPAAIVKSEHEMFLVRGNGVFRAVQEEEYLDDILLQAF
ncbi:MAG: hypothetical protein J6B90_09765 [Lachnospiraceae bacterium]|nr:hypothetical protein [Lachnospiraceae bacterium]